MQESSYISPNKLINKISTENIEIIVGLDLGAKKIGTAKGIVSLKMSLAIDVLHYKNESELANMIKNFIKETSAGAIVIGCTNFDEEYLNKYVAFIDSLNLGLPFTLEDENYTTKAANELLKESGLKRKNRNKLDDKFSAKLILDQFLNRLIY